MAALEMVVMEVEIILPIFLMMLAFHSMNMKNLSGLG
jgi:hypothetical protein